VAVSYNGLAIFLVEAPEIEPQGALNEIDRGEIVKLRNLTPSPRLLMRLGGRSRTIVRQEGLQGHESNCRSLVSVKA
jgi:hypothetical protein